MRQIIFKKQLKDPLQQDPQRDVVCCAFKYPDNEII